MWYKLLVTNLELKYYRLIKECVFVLQEGYLLIYNLQAVDLIASIWNSIVKFFQSVNYIITQFWLQDTYTMYVLESLSVGEPVLTLMAEDLDRNALLEYDIIEPISARDKTGNSLMNRVSEWSSQCK